MLELFISGAIGVFLGVNLGIFLMCLLAAARAGDQMQEDYGP